MYGQLVAVPVLSLHHWFFGWMEFLLFHGLAVVLLYSKALGPMVLAAVQEVLNVIALGKTLFLAADVKILFGSLS